MRNSKKVSEDKRLVELWDYDKNTAISPDILTVGSGRKAWWVCSLKHSWAATVNHMHQGNGCPYCSNKRILKGYNDLNTICPDMAAQWHPTKNGDLLPDMVSAGSHKTVWWICSKGHEWEAKISARHTFKSGCPYCAGQRPIQGESDLLTVRPEIAAEWDYDKNNGIRPSDVCYGSNKKYWWFCNNGHSWLAAPSARKKSGCPYCAGKSVMPGVNDLATLKPELAVEWDFDKNGILTPDTVMPGSHKQVWWRCIRNHSWKARINNRAHGRGCPYCGGHLVITGENDLKTLFPELAEQWDYQKNDADSPENVMAHAKRKRWWRCNNGHSWKCSPNMRAKGSSCPYCCGQALIKGENDLKTLCPDLADEWNYDKNELSPEEVFSQSNTDVWWKCKQGHEWKAKVSNRFYGKGCPYCSGRKAISGVNDIVTMAPAVAAEWCYSLNGKTSPETVSVFSGKKYWWQCRKGHQWKAVVASRTANMRGCPYCAGLYVIKGVNDFASLNPELSKEWAYDKNKIMPYEVSQYSNKSVWWRCSYGHIWKSQISNRVNGKGCPKCDGKMPYKRSCVS